MKRTLYLPFGLLILSSCSQDEEPARLLSVKDNEVAFFASLPEVATRSYDLTKKFPEYGITVSAFCPEEDPDENGILSIYGKEAIAFKEADGVFRSVDCRWPSNRDTLDGHLKFFAFHPSRVEMQRRAGVGDECFVYSNLTKKVGSEVTYDYRLTKFRVAPDISEQVDFVTAIGEGNKAVDLYSGVQLAFEHQLCGVSISVWGASSLYDIEIAGVRIGGTVVEADFDLSYVVKDRTEDENTIGSWLITPKSIRGYVDYVFTLEDKVVVINAKEHTTKDQAASIMGGGGKALLIPYKHDKWNYTTDKANQAGGMYFSALMRMTERDGDQHRIFPSTDPDSQDYLVYLSVRKSDGTVMQRLDKNGNVSGTTTKYDIPPSEELRQYGWAAVPVNVDWKAGYTYSYVLDYSKGVGLHDPADSNPATPIIDWGGVEVDANVGWESGEIIESGSWGANSNDTAPDGTIWWK